jgi:hypothetical protein
MPNSAVSYCTVDQIAKMLQHATLVDDKLRSVGSPVASVCSHIRTLATFVAELQEELVCVAA